LKFSHVAVHKTSGVGFFFSFFLSKYKVRETCEGGLHLDHPRQM